MIHLYYGTEDFEVSEFRSRKVIDEIKMLLSAFDCMIPDDAGVYCSSDVTTGRGLYFELFRENGVGSEEELKDKLGASLYKQAKSELIRRNIERGVEFTEKIRQRGINNLINPGPLYAEGFEQQHYYYLWECVIIKKVYKIFFNEGWEYSNGCTLEYGIGYRKGIPLLDHLGDELTLAAAKHKVEQAVAELRARGIRFDKLERNLILIKELGE
jgi:hypothetical protein